MSGTVDARIPMSYRPAPLGPDFGQAIATANNLLQFRQNQQLVQRQNALRNILGTPGAIDATGNPTPQTLSRVMAVDPDAGLKLQQNALVTQQRKLQMEALTTKTAYENASYLNDAYTPILEQYKENIASGMPEAAARHEAQQATDETTQRLQSGGNLPPSVTQNLPTKFEPGEFERRALQSKNYMQWWKEQQAEKKAQQTEQRSGEQTWNDSQGRPFILRPNMPAGQNATYLDGTPVPPEMLTGAGKAATAGAAATKPEDVLVDGKRTQARWMGNHWVDLEGNPIPTTSTVERVAKGGAPGSIAANREAIASDVDADPNFKNKSAGEKAAEVEHRMRVGQGLINTPEAIDQEAQQIASYSQPPLSGYALRSPDGIKIMARVKELNPDYSAPEYNNYNKTITAFGSGKQGDTIRYINNAIQHIDVMQKAADALGSGDVRTFNTIANELGREFGVAAPTTFDGLRQIVGTEIERAATGGVGAAVDRNRLIDSLNKANSPAQLRDVFKNFKALFGGQVSSLRQQYESATPDVPAFRGQGQFGFERKLLPETRLEVPGANQGGTAQGGGGAGTRGTPARQQAAAIPPNLETGVKNGTVVANADRTMFFDRATRKYYDKDGKETAAPGQRVQAAPPPAQQQQAGGIARPTTQAEYDALPSGTKFVNPADGKTYRKK